MFLLIDPKASPNENCQHKLKFCILGLIWLTLLWLMMHSALLIAEEQLTEKELINESYNEKIANIKGPDECGECHEKTVDIWRETHHARSFRDLPRSEEALAIAKKMGVKRIKKSSQCNSCHFTSIEFPAAIDSTTSLIKDQLESPKTIAKTKVIAGVACESCHGAGRDWIDIHSDFGGKDIEAEDEDPLHKIERYHQSEQAGMIRPVNIEGLMRNCLGCHLVADESLVNHGGHPATSAFEIVRWSQGEVRHNVWYTDENQSSSIERRRMLYMVGQVLSYEMGLRALAGATEKKIYAKTLAKFTKIAELRIKKMHTSLGDEVKELSEIIDIAAGTKLTLNNKIALQQAAKKVAKYVALLSANYDGKTLAAIDFMLPPPEKYKGDIYQ